MHYYLKKNKNNNNNKEYDVHLHIVGVHFLGYLLHHLVARLADPMMFGQGLTWQQGLVATTRVTHHTSTMAAMILEIYIHISELQNIYL